MVFKSPYKIPSYKINIIVIDPLSPWHCNVDMHLSEKQKNKNNNKKTHLQKTHI